MEVRRLTPKAIKKFFKDSFRLPRSFVPIDKPTPRIGPINRDISIAPITTAVELLFNPIEQITIEQINIQTLYPLNVISFSKLFLTSSCLMFSSLNLRVLMSNLKASVNRMPD